MLQLTSRGNYGILAVYYIASQAPQEFISIEEIAKNGDIPKPYLSKILQNLCRGGILCSRRGSGGGFSLARPPWEISLKDIVEIIEGKVALVHCLANPPRCDNSVNCPISPVWLEVQNIILEIIANITVEDIIRDHRKHKLLNVLHQCQKMYHEKLHELHAENENEWKK